MASMAGAWTALVEGFGGMRVSPEGLRFDPQLPDGLTRLAFRLRWHGMRLLVDVTADSVALTLRDGPDAQLDLVLAGETITLTTAEPVVRPWRRRPPLLPRPTQPTGRAPAQRG